MNCETTLHILGIKTLSDTLLGCLFYFVMSFAKFLILVVKFIFSFVTYTLVSDLGTHYQIQDNEDLFLCLSGRIV